MHIAFLGPVYAATIEAVWGAWKIQRTPPCRATRGSSCQGVEWTYFPSAEYKWI